MLIRRMFSQYQTLNKSVFVFFFLLRSTASDDHPSNNNFSGETLLF